MTKDTVFSNVGIFPAIQVPYDISQTLSGGDKARGTFGTEDLRQTEVVDR